MSELTGTEFYVRDGENRMWREIPLPNGEFEYVQADIGLAYLELANGKFIAARDTEVAQANAEGSSHHRYFKLLDADGQHDPKKVKQSLKRVDALERQLEQLAIDRVSPGGSPNVQIVKDSQLMDLNAEYTKAVQEGRVHEYADEGGFMPFTSYAQKLITRSGKQIRPVLKGEVGMRGATIFVLEQGYGTGNLVAVTEQIGNGPREEG